MNEFIHQYFLKFQGTGEKTWMLSLWFERDSQQATKEILIQRLTYWERDITISEILDFPGM